MELITQTECAKRYKTSQQYIAKLIKEGKIKKYDKGRVDWIEFKNYIETFVQEEAKRGSADKNKKKQPFQSKITYAEAKTHREAFNAKIAELTYREMHGELIRIQDAKKAIEHVVVPINSGLDTLAIMFKAKFPEVPLEAVNWLSQELNDLKIQAEKMWREENKNAINTPTTTTN